MTILGEMIFKDGEARGEARVEARWVRLIRRKYDRGMSAEEITDLLEEEKDYVRKVTALLEENPDRSDMEIAEMVLEEARQALQTASNTARTAGSGLPADRQ